MKKTLFSGAILSVLIWQNPALAELSVEERLQRMELAIAQLQQKIDSQEATIERQAATIAAQRETLESGPVRRQSAEPGGDAWYQNVEVGGVIEVEAGHHSPYQGDSESDIVLATFELGISARVSDWVEAGGTLLYEEDDTPLDVDTAYLTIANPGASPLYVTAGQIYLPFGAFETSLVSDPLTLEIGEARESAVQAGFVSGDFGGSAYAFNGTNKKDGDNRIGAWGLNRGFARATGANAWGIGFGYISDLGDSDSLQEVIADNRGDNAIAKRVGGWTLNAGARIGSFNLIGEYLTAGDSFDAADVPWQLAGAEPSAFNIELGYGFSMMGKDAVVALAYQGTREALALELPKERWLIGLSVDILDNTALSFEWAHDTDYGVADGGSGENADTVTAQLAVEF